MISVERRTRPPKKDKIPPLKHGDRLTAAEFHRRYEAMPEVKKAELINGVVYMGSPVRMKQHGSPHGSMSVWLATYHAHTPGTEFGPNSTMKLEIGENEPQPDDLLRILEEYGGQSRIDDDGYLVGAAELIAEISASTTQLDLNEKLDVFEQNGVLECIVWRTEDQEIDWFFLKNGKYQPLARAKDGLFKSKAFPGLWLDAEAMIAGDKLKLLDTLQKGIASPEHRRFVAKLRAKKK